MKTEQTPWSVMIQSHAGIIHGIVMAGNEAEAVRSAIERNGDDPGKLVILSKSVLPITIKFTDEP